MARREPAQGARPRTTPIDTTPIDRRRMDESELWDDIEEAAAELDGLEDEDD
jgi:hypothetical protein